MKTVRDHYNEFLGPVYSWILGDFESASQKSAALFDRLNIRNGDGQLAADLGAGPGNQAVPLAQRGFEVIAIDFCEALVEELEGHAGRLPIRAVCDDILNFEQHLERAPDLVTCMGDTLVHLPNAEAVQQLLARIAAVLAPGGKFIYAIRDYVGFEPRGADRFVPIRANDEQIFTCFLDYRPDVVHVHDVLHQKVGDTWQMTISDYLKLRLDTAVLNRQLADDGLQIASTFESEGMLVVVAVKPA